VCGVGRIDELEVVVVEHHVLQVLQVLQGSLVSVFVDFHALRHQCKVENMTFQCRKVHELAPSHLGWIARSHSSERTKLLVVARAQRLLTRRTLRLHLLWTTRSGHYVA